MTVQRLAILSIHTSPIAAFGGKKIGGMNVYVRELAQEFGRMGILVDIFTRAAHTETLKIDHSLGDNIRVINLAAGPPEALDPTAILPYLADFTTHLIAFATVNNLKYDIAYSHYWLSGLVAMRLKEAWGLPFVQMFHTLGQMKQRIIEQGIAPDIRIRSESDIVEQADIIIAATHAEQSQLLWLYRADRRKIVIIPPGVNLKKFNIKNRPSYDKLAGSDVEKIRFLFVGRIEPLKGIDTILEALVLIREAHYDLFQKLRLYIVGGNPADTTDTEMQRLLHLVETLYLEKTVCFLGAKEQSSLSHFYAEATAVLMPSDYESFGMVALEAMASGTPVIASQVGGLAYLIKDQVTGYLVPVRQADVLANRIVNLSENPDLVERMGRAAASLARQYAWPHIAFHLVQVFENILSGKDLSHHKNWAHHW